MHFPKYWAKGSVADLPQRNIRTGEFEGPFGAWGWSDVSLEEAQRHGQERATKVAEAVLRHDPPGRYPYGRSPFREDVLERWQEPGEEPHAVVSRNSYGCLVLNTSDVMFVDIDRLESWWGQQTNGWIQRLVRRLLGQPPPPPPRTPETWLAEALERAESVVAADPGSGIRVYRTAGGLRLLMTHTRVDPASDASRQLMEYLEADPLYVTLCQSARCYRARLTPKPWRCGLRAMEVDFPWTTAAAQEKARAWIARYEQAAQRYATCELVTTFGRPAEDAVIRRVVEHHDRECRVGTGLELA